VVHVEGKIAPLDDIEVINTELALADLESVEKQITRNQKIAKSGNKEAKAMVELLEKCRALLDEGKPLRAGDWDKDDWAQISKMHFITSKPTMYIANVAEDGFENNPYLDQVREYAAAENAEVVAVCAAIEAELAGLEAEEQQEFLSEMGLDEPGLNRVIRAGYKLLNLHTYFTAGVKEVRAWTIPVGATAPKAAGVIHTDFEKGFIRAEVVSYEDFIAHNGEQGAKDAGKWRLEGKDYIVQDGDVIHFRFNV
jgi:hypothetical protein